MLFIVASISAKIVQVESQKFKRLAGYGIKDM